MAHDVDEPAPVAIIEREAALTVEGVWKNIGVKIFPDDFQKHRFMHTLVLAFPQASTTDRL